MKAPEWICKLACWIQSAYCPWIRSDLPSANAPKSTLTPSRPLVELLNLLMNASFAADMKSPHGLSEDLATLTKSLAIEEEYLLQLSDKEFALFNELIKGEIDPSTGFSWVEDGQS